jgi:hypothetical protein
VLAPDKDLFPAQVFASRTGLFFFSRFHSPLLRFFLPALCPGEQALRPSTRFFIWMRGAGSRLLIFPSLQIGARRAGTASDLFTRCCCFHLLAAFSLILYLLVPSNLAHMSAAHVGLKFLLISFFRLGSSSVFSAKIFLCLPLSYSWFSFFFLFLILFGVLLFTGQILSRSN